MKGLSCRTMFFGTMIGLFLIALGILGLGLFLSDQAKIMPPAAAGQPSLATPTLPAEKAKLPIRGEFQIGPYWVKVGPSDIFADLPAMKICGYADDQDCWDTDLTRRLEPIRLTHSGNLIDFMYGTETLRAQFAWDKRTVNFIEGADIFHPAVTTTKFAVDPADMVIHVTVGQSIIWMKFHEDTLYFYPGR